MPEDGVNAARPSGGQPASADEPRHFAACRASPFPDLPNLSALVGGTCGTVDPVTPKNPHVSGWAPDFLPARSQFDRHVDRLRSLVGGQVSDAWVVWNLENDDWFADLPVVLQMKHGAQLEVCWEKFDELSITWGTIDVSVRPRAWVEWPLEWRPRALPVLASVEGATVQDLAVSSFLFKTQNMDHPHNVSAVWLTTGLWIGTESGGLHIFNALDENGVSSQLPPRDNEHDWRTI